MLGSADLDIPRFNLANNRAELALAHGDFVEAKNWYVTAAKRVGQNMPTYVKEVVSAGLGLCALEMGQLSEARRREQEVKHSAPWFYDPTTILMFRSKLLERRGCRADAIRMLESEGPGLARRHVFAWLKIGGLLVDALIRERQFAQARETAEIYRAKALELNLSKMAAEFSARIQRVAKPTN